MTFILPALDPFLEASIAFLDGQWFHRSMVKNVLYICPSSGLGGAETFIKNTWLGHDKSRFSPQYLLFSDGPLAKWLADNKAPYDILLEKPRLSQPWSWFKAARAIRKFIKARNIHLVHSTMAYGALFAALASIGVPHVWFQHGPASGWMDQAAAVLPHRLLLTNSRSTTEKQRELERPVDFLVGSRLLRQIDLGIAEPEFTPSDVNEFRLHLLEKYNLSASACLIGMACRIQEWKGVHDLLKAADILSQSFADVSPAPFYVFIWGEAFGDPAYFQSVKKYAEHLPATFEGVMSDVRFALGACDVVVNASTQPEPFGLTLIEGMSTGAIPVAPAWGGPAEIITPGENGLLYEPRNAKDLSRQLKVLIENKALREKLKMNAQKTYFEKYTLKKMIDSLEMAYDQALALH